MSQIGAEVAAGVMEAGGSTVLASVSMETAEGARGAQERAALRQRIRRLEADLEEREILLQEVHHRVSNNLQVIASLINLQLRVTGAERSRDVLLQCRARVQAIALVHERLHRSTDQDHVPFAEYARGLVSDVFRAAAISPSDVCLQLAVEDVALAPEKAIPCGLILGELVTNALRHGFADGRRGTLRVEVAASTDGAVRLAVIDDGAGLPAGFDPARPPSLGLRVVHMLVRQLDGRLDVEGGSRTAFRVTLPGAA
jgi:two-component sensor histidine kinase